MVVDRVVNKTRRNSNITILAQDKPNIEIPLAQKWLTILYQDHLLIGISMDQYWTKYNLVWSCYT